MAQKEKLKMKEAKSFHPFRSRRLKPFFVFIFAQINLANGRRKRDYERVLVVEASINVHDLVFFSKLDSNVSSNAQSWAPFCYNGLHEVNEEFYKPP